MGEVWWGLLISFVMKNEIARPKVILDGKQAEDELDKLTQKAKKLKDALLDAASAGDPQAEKRLQQQLKATNTEIRNMKKEAFDVQNVLKNINGASFNELSQAVRKATNDLHKMKQTDPGLAGQQKTVVALKTKLAELSNEQRANTPLWGRITNGANKYFNVLAGGVIAITGLIFSVREIIKSFEDFEARMANLSAITGLTGEDLTWLGEKAKELSTTTLEGGIRITKSATDIVDAFEKMGSARPDLLKNKEDLVEVTKAALILAEGSKLETLPAIEAVAAAMNQFGLGASEANRIINAMGAGSLAGSSEVDDLTKSLSTCGTVAANSNLSLEQTVGVLETLAERQLKGEEAGTQFKTSLISLKAAGLGYVSGVFNMRDAIVELKAKIDAKNTSLEKDNELIKVFGKRNITVGTILTTSIDRFDYFTKAVTGTNVAFEQAAVNTDTHAAKLAQASNRLNLMSIELGEKLTPALTISTSGLAYFVKGLSIAIDLFIETKGVLIPLTASVIGYTIAAKAAAIWEERRNAANILNIVQTKLKAFWTGAERAGLILLTAAQALLTGNVEKATIAMRLFRIETGISPIGIFFAILAAGITVLTMYSRGLTAAQQAQKAVNDVNLEAHKSIVEEKINLEALVETARNEKLSKEERLKAIKQLNELSPAYLGNLTLESIHTQKATDAVNDYTTAILQNAKAQAAKEKLIEIEKELLDLASGKGADPTVWQSIWNGFIIGGTQAELAAKRQEVIASNQKKKMDELNQQKEKIKIITKELGQEEQKNSDASVAYAEKETGAMYKFMSALKTVGDFVKNNPIKYIIPGGSAPKPVDIKPEQDLIKLKEEELKIINERIAATPKDIAARNKEAEAKQKEIDALKELGTSKADKSKDKIKEDAYKALDISNRKELNLVKQHQIDIKATDEEYNKTLEEEEMNALNKKLALQIKYGDDTSDTMAAILDKQLKAQEELDKKTAEDKKKSYKKDLDDLENKGKNELAQVKKDALAKGLPEEETNALLIAKEIEYLNKKLELQQKYGEDTADTAAAIAEKINALAENALKGDEDRLKELDKLKKKYGEDEVNAKKERDDALAELDKAQKAGLIKNEEEYQQLKAKINKKYEQTKLNQAIEFGQKAQQIVSFGSNLVQTLMDAELAKAGDNEEKKAQIHKKYATAQFLMATAEIVVNTAVAIMQGFAQLGPIGGAIAAVLLTATGVAQLAIANSQRQTMLEGKQEGGYSNYGSDSEPDGIYHKNEFIASAPAVRNPTVKPILDIINLAQQNGTIAQLNLPNVLAATGMLPAGRQSGGYSSDASPSSTSGSGGTAPVIIPSSGSGMSDKQLDRLSAILERLDSKDFAISIEMLERKQTQYKKITGGGLK